MVFGYSKSRPVLWLLGFLLIGCIVFGIGWQTERFDPAVPFIYNTYATDAATGEERQRHGPPYLDLSTDPDRLPQYPQFVAPVYSLDTLVPIVNLHQEPYWMPTGWVRIYLWLHIAAGWVFTTMAVVGFTGLVRKE